MVAGGCACLDSECLDSFWPSLEYTCNLCLFTQAWLFSVYNEQTWPFGTCLCLRLIRVIDSSVARLWLLDLIAHLFPIQTKATICTQCISSYQWITAICTCWRWAFEEVTGLLEIQSWKLKSNRIKVDYGEVQVLYSVTNWSSPSSVLQVWGGGFENQQKSCYFSC